MHAVPHRFSKYYIARSHFHLWLKWESDIGAATTCEAACDDATYVLANVPDLATSNDDTPIDDLYGRTGTATPRITDGK